MNSGKFNKAIYSLLFLVVFLCLFTTNKGFCNKNYVALTFDDGPNPPYTEQLLDILEKYKIKATFFFIGRNIEMHRNTAIEVVKRGHEIGNHGYMHENLALKTPNKIINEISKTDSLIKGLGLSEVKLFRPPFGSGLLSILISKLVGETLVLQGLSPIDYLRPSPDKIVYNIMKNIKPCSIITLHDGEGIRVETIVATELLINKLSENYEFVTASSLLKICKL